MTSAPDREFLLSVFLMDAWDGVAALEDAIRAGVRAPQAALVAARRVEGVATSHDFSGISALASSMEGALARLPSLTGAARTEMLDALGAGIALLKTVLDDVATGRCEDAPAIGAFIETQLGPPAPSSRPSSGRRRRLPPCSASIPACWTTSVPRWPSTWRR